MEKTDQDQKLSEKDWIRRWTADCPTGGSVELGIGDDCALVRVPESLSDSKTHRLDLQLVLKTDAVVEGVHFTVATEPSKIGRKALARCLSDFAAMSAMPDSALITIGVPGMEGNMAERMDGIYQGLSACAREFGVSIVGGETTRSPGALWISVALSGWVESGRAPRRSGAQVGDAIFVSGELGGSISGKHLDFVPRVRESRWLTSNLNITSMIDISDGVAGDLGQIVESSGVGADLRALSIPISKEAKLQAAQGNSAKPALIAALTDGEDFELLFTVPAKDAVPALDGWKANFPETQLSCIGKITSQTGIRTIHPDSIRTLHPHGYNHFQ
jgi:thiamine-monophosphate kinase